MDAGCNVAVDIKRGLYLKTTVRVTTFVNASSCGASPCPSGSVCCRDPSASGLGACFAVKDCAVLPADSGTGGDLLSIDMRTGKIKSNVSLTQGIHPSFGAYNEADQRMYSVVPYSYTEYGVFAYDPATGNVTQAATFPKEQLDGIGVCIGQVIKSRYLVYMFSSGASGDNLVVLDLTTLKIVNQVPGFFGPIAVDPLFPDKLLAIQNVKNNGGVAVVSVDPLTNRTATLLRVPSTTLGRDLRAQDQAAFAVDAVHGTDAWFVASYNVKNGSLARGMFKASLAKDRSSGTAGGSRLVSQQEAWGDADGKPWLGRVDYLQ